MMLGMPFLIVALAVSTSHGREYSCTVDEALCTGSGGQSITMNGVTKCCPAQATMTINNNQCVCTESAAASDEFSCLQEYQVCSSGTAGSYTTDSAGNVRCCPLGHHMTSFIKADPQGQVTETCTCKLTGGSRSSFSSFLGRFFGGGGGSRIMSAFPGLLDKVNMTSAGQQSSAGGNSSDVLDQWREIGQSWKTWGQQFAKGFQTWGRNFGHSMRDTGRDLARDLTGVLQTTLRRSALPIQRALNDMVGNVFSSIPGK